MRPQTCFAISAAIGVWIACAPGALSAEVTLIYKGEIAQLVANSGDLISLGAPVTATFEFDTSRGNHHAVAGIWSDVDGGSNATPPAQTPLISSSIVIGGELTQQIIGSFYSRLYAGADGVYPGESFSYANNGYALDPITQSQNYITAQALGRSPVFQADLNNSYFYSGPFLPDTGGFFDLTYDRYENDVVTTNRYAGYFSISSVEEISSVPEAHTWTMALIGFATLGFLAYCKTGVTPFSKV